MGMSTRGMRRSPVTASPLLRQGRCASRRLDWLNLDLLNHCGAGISYSKEGLIS